MTGRYAALALAAVTASACGVRDAQDDWDATAARAVARAEAALEPQTPLVAHPSVGGDGGAELPWGVRQSLTTGGIEVAAGEVPQGVRVLTFDAVRRDGGDWIYETSVRRDGDVSKTQWRVHCSDSGCTATPES